jgi:ubiquinone/menaquinone biosynthesis C-methylase UbiE
MGRNLCWTLLKTNKYPRSKDEFNFLEMFLPNNDLILEAGYGLSPKLIHFDSKSYQILRIDYIFSALEQVKKYDPNIFLAQSDLHAFPFPESNFGAYLSYGVVEHFPQGPQVAIIEAYRILKPGGLSFMMVQASNRVTQFVYDDQNILHNLRRNGLVIKFIRKPHLQTQEEHLTCFKFYGKDEMRIILETLKCKIIHEQPMSHSFNFYLGSECFQKDTNGKTNSLAEGLAAVLRKFFS